MLLKIPKEDSAPFILQAMKNKNKNVVMRKYPVTIKGILATKKEADEYLFAKVILTNKVIMSRYYDFIGGINPDSGMPIFEFEKAMLYKLICEVYSYTLGARYHISELIDIYNSYRVKFGYIPNNKGITMCSKITNTDTDMISRINNLEWNEYIEYNGLLYGKPHVVDDIHVADNCLGEVIPLNNYGNNPYIDNKHVCVKCGAFINIKCFGY
jgi:hypothetical protein